METMATHGSRQAALTHPDRIDALIEADALELCGNVEAADRLRKRSIAGASEVDLNCYAYTLLWRNRIDRAISLLEDNAAAHPDSWNAYDSLADAPGSSVPEGASIDSTATSVIDGDAQWTALSAILAFNAIGWKPSDLFFSGVGGRQVIMDAKGGAAGRASIWPRVGCSAKSWAAAYDDMILLYSACVPIQLQRMPPSTCLPSAR